MQHELDIEDLVHAVHPVSCVEVTRAGVMIVKAATDGVLLILSHA